MRRALTIMLGHRRAAALVQRLRRGSTGFSEAQLIYEYFYRRRAPGLLVDVGAHFGESFEPYMRRGWNVIAFEPDAENRSRAQQKANDNVKLLPYAISDRESERVPFYRSAESDGISTLAPFRSTHVEAEAVPLTTLRTVLSKYGIQKVTFLKIDTEGHDLYVLKGFPWERMRPEVILCEFEDRKTVPLGYNHRTLGDFLLQLNYRVYISEWAPIVTYGGRHQWRSWNQYPHPLENREGWGNFVAFCPGADLSAIEIYLRRFQQ